MYTNIHNINATTNITDELILIACVKKKLRTETRDEEVIWSDLVPSPTVLARRNHKMYV